MRNSIVVSVYEMANQLVAHFGNLSNSPENGAKATIEVRAGKTISVNAPNKLQGSDFNLLFPLHATKSADALDFAEIENILVINGVANNVTSMAVISGQGSQYDWNVTFNEAEK